MKLQNDVIQALDNYCARLSDDVRWSKKYNAREEAACMAREYRTVNKLRKILTECKAPESVPVEAMVQQ